MTERHTVDLDDGVTLRVEVQGAGPAIVLLHGFTGDASTMDVLTDRLAVDHTVIVPNLIGHGDSTGPVGAYGVDEMAAQTVAMVDALEHPSPFDLVGYSMGGRVALTVACRFPAHVASLSLIGASGGLTTDDERTARREADEALAASILDGDLGSFVDRWMANPLFATQARLGDDFLAAARAQRMRNSPDELARSLLGAGTGSMRPLHDLLVECRVPTNLLVGADDTKFRAIAAELEASLPDARVTTIDHAGHAAHLEQPDAVAESIRHTAGRAAGKLFSLSLPLRGSHTTGRGTTTRRDGVLLRLRADGHTGWGELSPLPGWSIDGEGPQEASLARGLPAESVEGICAWEATTEWRESLADAPAARAAVVGAALDLDARRRRLPLHRYLAEWHPRLGPLGAISSLAVNALVSATDPDAVAELVARHAANGFTTVKLKVGAVEPALDLARVRAARAAAPRVDLRIDANGAWDHRTAVDFLGQAAASGVVLCEEPVRGIDAIAAVGRACDVPVAVDESVRSADDLADVFRHADAIAALVLKPQARGGADRTIEAVIAARRVGLEVIITSMIDSAIGLAHAAHVAAACGLDSAHGLATADLLDVDVAPGLTITGGRLVMPTTPGLGIGPVSPPPVRSP